TQPSPRAERTRPKTERHSALDSARRAFARLAVAEARADEVTTSVEQQVRDLLERYRLALQSKNLDEVASVYAAFSERQKNALRTYLANAKDLVVEFSDIQVTPSDGGVTVSFVRRDHFTDAESGRVVRLEVRLTKVLVREQSTWKIGSGQ
ncbi:MAG: nuclear transport factor 2 family protein, partial [bacterium]